MIDWDKPVETVIGVRIAVLWQDDMHCLLDTRPVPTLVTRSGYIANGLGDGPVIRNVRETVSRWCNVYKPGVHNGYPGRWWQTREAADQSADLFGRLYVIREDCTDGKFSIEMESV